MMTTHVRIRSVLLGKAAVANPAVISLSRSIALIFLITVAAISGVCSAPPPLSASNPRERPSASPRLRRSLRPRLPSAAHAEFSSPLTAAQAAPCGAAAVATTRRATLSGGDFRRDESLDALRRRRRLGGKVDGWNLSLRQYALAANRTRRRDPLNGMRVYEGGYDPANLHYWASLGVTAGGGFAVMLAGAILLQKSMGMVRDGAVERVGAVVKTVYNVSQAMAGLTVVDVDAVERCAELWRAACGAGRAGVLQRAKYAWSIADGMQSSFNAGRDTADRAIKYMFMSLFAMGAVITALGVVGVVLALIKLVILSNIVITIMWVVAVVSWCFTSIFFLSAMLEGDTALAANEILHDPSLQHDILGSLPCSSQHSLASVRASILAASAQATSLVNSTVATSYPQVLQQMPGGPYSAVCVPYAPAPSYTPTTCPSTAIDLQSFAVNLYGPASSGMAVGVVEDIAAVSMGNLYGPASSGMAVGVVEDIAAVSMGVAALGGSLATMGAAANCSYGDRIELDLQLLWIGFLILSLACMLPSLLVSPHSPPCFHSPTLSHRPPWHKHQYAMDQGDRIEMNLQLLWIGFLILSVACMLLALCIPVYVYRAVRLGPEPEKKGDAADPDSPARCSPLNADRLPAASTTHVPPGLKPPRGTRARGMSYAGEGEGEGDGAGSGAAGRTAFRVAEKRFKLVKEDTGQRRRRRGQQRGQGSDAAAGEGGSAEGALAGAVDFRALEQRFLATGHLADTAAPAATAAAGASGGAGSATAGGGGAACVAAVAVSSIVREEGAAGLPCPVYTVQGRPGFFFLPGALTVQQQAQLIQEAVQGSVEPPNRTNHTAALGAIHGLWPAFALSCAAASDQGSTEHGGGDDGGGGGGGGSSSRRRVSAVLRPCVGGGEAEGVQCAGKRGMGGEAREWGGENGWRGKLRWATLGVQFDWSKPRCFVASILVPAYSLQLYALEVSPHCTPCTCPSSLSLLVAFLHGVPTLSSHLASSPLSLLLPYTITILCLLTINHSPPFLTPVPRTVSLPQRAYDPSLPFRPFPTFLAHLASRLAAPAMPSAHATFSPEAAIVNFYHPGLPPSSPCLCAALACPELGLTSGAGGAGVVVVLVW
ncbi:unnamed protein product [Closterium sp. NIES-64]|nr:unnamed protein product [Closterium sp. NIES-64]